MRVLAHLVIVTIVGVQTSSVPSTDLSESATLSVSSLGFTQLDSERACMRRLFTSAISGPRERSERELISGGIFGEGVVVEESSLINVNVRLNQAVELTLLK